MYVADSDLIARVASDDLATCASGKGAPPVVLGGCPVQLEPASAIGLGRVGAQRFAKNAGRDADALARYAEAIDLAGKDELGPEARR